MKIITDAYCNVTRSEEVIGDQSEVDVIHIALKGSCMFSCYEVNRGREQLQKEQNKLKPCNIKFLELYWCY